MAIDAEYYGHRIAEELFAADTSPSAAAQHCHRKLAEAYAKKLEALNKEQTSSVQLAA
jgi:hypothetical protein